MANYPSVVTTFTNPNPTDKLSTTPHSSIETAQNTDLTAIETFVGTLSSNVGTLVYDIRGANSNGGGHVQTANKGGTGQTAYTKGDILVATSSSVLTKLAVSANDNDFLTVDSSVAAGVKWNAGVTSGQIQNMAFSNATDTGTGSVYSISPVPCVLSYSEGQIFTFRAANANTIAAPALNVSSLVSKIIKNADGTALNVGQIPASAMTMVQYQGNASVFHLMSVTKPIIPKAVLATSRVIASVLDSSATLYTTPMSGDRWSATEPSGLVVPFAGTIKNLYVRTSDTQGGPISSVVVRKNSTNTALKVTSLSASSVAADVTNSFSVVPGDLITIAATNGSGGSSNSPFSISMELDAT